MKSKLFFSIMLTALLNGIIERSNAQTAEWLWAKSIGGPGWDAGNAIAVDQETDDVYTTGVFSGTVDFDPGWGIYNLTSTGGNDIFISKTNAAGNFVWALRIGAALNDVGFSIAVDASGYIYLTGHFFQTVDFDPGEGIFNLTSAGSADIFILKIDSDGNFIWAKSIGGISFDSSKSLALDPSGSGGVYIRGEFNRTVDFDPGINTYNLTHAASSNAVFVLKLDSFGNFIWALKLDVDPFGGTNGVAPYGGFAKSIAVDASGNLYITGWFHGTVDLFAGEGTVTLTATGENDIFILKLDARGKCIWARSMRGTLRSIGHSVAVDASGNVYTSGSFRGTVDFDPGGARYNLTAQGSVYGDIFISKFDSAGHFVWAKGFGGTDGDSGNSIVVDPESGDIYTTGMFTGTVDFDPDEGIFNLTSAGDYDVFISRMDSFGNFIEAKAIGGLNVDYGYCIALSSSGSVHVVGGFTGPSISFGPTTLTNEDNVGNHLDIFMAKFNISIPLSFPGIKTQPIIIYPNPVKDELMIKVNDEVLSDVSISMFNLRGELVFSSTHNNISQELILDVHSLPATMYLVEVNVNGNKIVKQIVKAQE